MSVHWIQYLSGAAAIYCWLIAGVFLAFSDFVMKSLGALPAAQGVAAMQSINVLVYRSIFMVGLFAVSGISLIFIANGYLDAGVALGLPIAAAVVYLSAVMGVTAIGNIPLNNELAAVDPASPAAPLVWTRYLTIWVKWNHVRTIGAAAAAGLMTVATFTAV